MNRHDFFTTELSKLLLLQEQEIEEFLKRYTYFLRKEQQKTNLTTTLVARGLNLILKDIREKRKEKKQKNIFENIKHKCLIKHKEKFLELAKLGLGCKAISKYFEENLHCNISHTTIQKALNNLKKAKKRGNLRGSTFEKQIKNAMHRLDARGTKRYGTNSRLTHSNALYSKREMYLKDFAKFAEKKRIRR